MALPLARLAHLHGDLRSDGFSLRIWQFQAGRDSQLDVAPTAQTLLLAVNFSGKMLLATRSAHARLPVEHLVIDAQPNRDAQWVIAGGGWHRGLLVEFGPMMLERLSESTALRNSWMSRRHTAASHVSWQVRPATASVLSLAQQLSEPPSHAACLPIWFHAKVMELASMTLFVPDPTPMETQPETSGREALERALFLLERDLENPPTLEMLAQEVGCGPFHLSRLFGRLTGKTMPEFLRQKRMERAALLLRTTKQSVSEIALTVGYESFSAFTRGFVRERGMTPSAYRTVGHLEAKPAQLEATPGKQDSTTC